MKKDSIDILIGGDICPSGEAAEFLKVGNVEDVFHDLLPGMLSADYTIVNLETPLTDIKSPIIKDGAALCASPSVLKGLACSGINALGLANNHIFDQGVQGLDSTIENLTKYNLEYFGAGKTLKHAREPHIVNIKDKSVGFMAVAEHEFSIAGRDYSGACPLDIVENVRQLHELKKKSDYVIILFHGGKEHYVYPTPNQQKISRFFIEEGADVVVAQHSHIIGTYEKYNHGLIVYGQGNFIFEKVSRDYPTWFEGILIALTFTDAGLDFQWIPFEQNKACVGAKKMADLKAEILIKEFEERSKDITDPDFVKKKWLELCRSETSLYKSRLMGHSRILRVLNRWFNFSHWFYSKEKLNMVRNVVECETHREGLETLWADKESEF